MAELLGRTSVEIAVLLREAETARLLRVAHHDTAPPASRAEASRDGHARPRRERRGGLARFLVGPARRPRPIGREPEAK